MANIQPLERKYVKSKLALLRAGLEIAESAAERLEEATTHIRAVDDNPNFQLDPEFPPGLEWFNTPAPLSFEGALRGKIVVLDFFTYCCINCMHVLPDLAQLERTHPPEGGVVVVGVHSAKFKNEKVPQNITNAIARYDIRHPVVNDEAIELWERLGVTCWPTLVIIGPQKQLLHCIIGEGHSEELMTFIDAAVQYYASAGRLSLEPVGLAIDGGAGLRGSVLKFPGKVCVDPTGRHLYVSDTGNHRVLVVSRETGVVESIYGSGEAGKRDGVGTGAGFHSPQGLAWRNEALYVADTGNHLLRKIDLSTHVVSTLAGTGCRGNDKEGGGVGTEQVISSPWDVAVGSFPGSDRPNLLYIAMAGTHQIWVHYLEDVGACVAGTTQRLSGSGDEANRNNTYAHKASFAQPSGLTLSADGVLFVADSESSTVRAVVAASGAAKAVVGGAIDPLDLFAFGDVDGKGREVRLQHPMGVAWSEGSRCVYVADSYNHKVKVVNPASKTCVTLGGTGQSGLTDGPTDLAQFSEPGGLCVCPEGRTLFVADTNNHAIRIIDLDGNRVVQFPISIKEITSVDQTGTVATTAFRRLTGRRAENVQCGGVSVPAVGSVGVRVHVQLPAGCHWTEEAPSRWQVIPGAAGAPFSLQGGQEGAGSLTKSDVVSIQLFTAFKGDQKKTTLEVEIAMYFCEESGVCHMREAILLVPLSTGATVPCHTDTEIMYSPKL